MDNILNINKDLWQAIEVKYSDEHYTNAILDSINYLGGVIREKANVTLDGDEMAKHVFSLNNPKIRLTKLQSKSERSVQKGAMESISGLYSLIRNPRSHKIENDSKKDADAIIKYVDYLLGLIIEAEADFSIDYFIEIIKDKHYVDTKEYTELVLHEIPVEKRYESLLALYSGLGDYLSSRHESLFQAILKSIPKEQKEEFLAILSKDLQTMTSNGCIATILNIISSHDWLELKPISKVRVEKIIYQCIDYARDDEFFHDSYDLAITSARRIDDFSNAEELKEIIFSNINNAEYSNLMFNEYWHIISETDEHGRFREEFRLYVIKNLEAFNISLTERIGEILKKEDAESIWNLEFANTYNECIDLPF